MTQRSFQKKKLERTEQLLQMKHEQLKEGLPHLYGWPWYSWAYNFFKSTNKQNLLCAANQISKSTTMIRKSIHWATSPKIWKQLWFTKPTQFWYLYPNKDTSTAEFETKWVPECMPRGEFESHPLYGWKAKYDSGKIHHIKWNSGLVQYFKTYAQNVKDLQSGTVYAMFCDEELPEELYDELLLRLAGSDGYFHMVFTATLNQQLWYRAIEAVGKEAEFLPKAFKQQISMYDCLVYKNGQSSPWTKERIQFIKDSCRSENEVLRRVYGRFVADEGRKYPAFDPAIHYMPATPVPRDWHRYAAVDVGSGGPHGHPAAISFLAIRPDHQYGEIYDAWRGDGIETTSGDILEKFRQMRGDQSFTIQSYDFAAKDFEIIATRQGEGFMKAEKSHEMGEDAVNSLFKNNMLRLHDTPEIRKMGAELMSLMKDTPKKKAKDDLADTLRYNVVTPPWDWSAIKKNKKIEKPREKWLPETDAEWDKLHTAQRRGEAYGPRTEEDEFQAEIDFWNDQYGDE